MPEPVDSPTPSPTKRRSALWSRLAASFPSTPFFIYRITLQVYWFFFSSRRRHTRCLSDWSSDVCSSDLDPERNFMGHLCATGEDGCAGDVRLYDWGPNGYGVVQKVLFTARSGATISGRVWATRRSEERRVGKECRSRWSLHEEMKQI